MSRSFAAGLAVLLLITAGARPAAAHPGRTMEARLDVKADGTFALRVTFDLPAFALNERPMDAPHQPLLALLDGGDATLKRYLDDAAKRFARHLKILADGRPAEVEAGEFPRVADVRRLDNRDARPFVRLPILCDVTFTGRLPAGAAAVTLRLPPVLGDFVLVAEVPGREPQGALVEPDKESPPVQVAPPLTTRPADAP